MLLLYQYTKPSKRAFMLAVSHFFDTRTETFVHTVDLGDSDVSYYMRCKTTRTHRTKQLVSGDMV